MTKRTSVRQTIKKNALARNILHALTQTYRESLVRDESYLEEDLFLAEARLEIVLNISNKRVRRFVIREMNKIQKDFVKHLA